MLLLINAFAATCPEGQKYVVALKVCVEKCAWPHVFEVDEVINGETIPVCLQDCGDNAGFYTETNGVLKCVEGCPGNITITGQYGLNAKCIAGICPEQFPYFVLNDEVKKTGKCQPACVGTEANMTDSVNKRCYTICPDHHYYHSAGINYCTKTCTEDLSRELSDGMGQIICMPTCTGETPLIGPNGQCTSECGVGLVEYNKSCHLTCPMGTEFQYSIKDPNTKKTVCTDTCPSGYYKYESMFRAYACVPIGECDPKVNYTQVVPGIKYAACYEKCPQGTFAEPDKTCAYVCKANEFGYNGVCNTGCPAGTYLFNGTDPINALNKPINLCFDKCPNDMYTEASKKQCVVDCHDGLTADKGNMTCNSSSNWIYILIGCIGGAIALVAVIVVIIFIAKSGVCNRSKYQKVSGGLITYG